MNAQKHVLPMGLLIERELQIALARRYAVRLYHLNLLLRLRGANPIVGPAIRVL